MKLRSMKDAPTDGTAILAYQSLEPVCFGNGPMWIYWKNNGWHGTAHNLPAPYLWDGWLSAEETHLGNLAQQARTAKADLLPGARRVK